MKNNSRSFYKNYKYDRLSLIFQLIEECGGFPYNVFGCLQKNSQQPHWIFLPHTRFDGYGGFYYLLQQNGYYTEGIPQNENKHTPSWFKKFKLFVEVMQRENQKFTPVKWNNFNEKEKFHGQAKVISWHIFNEDDTVKLFSLSNKSRINLSSLLIWALKNSIEKTLISKYNSGLKEWLIPINMRGQIYGKDPTAIQSTSFRIALSQTSSPWEINKKIQFEQEHQIYWGYYWQAQLPHYLGKRIVKKILLTYLDKPSHVMASFSDLGVWTANKIQGESSDWLYCPPTGYLVPIGAGSLIFNNKLSIALQLHPALDNDQGVTENTFSIWLDHIHMIVKDGESSLPIQ